MPSIVISEIKASLLRHRLLDRLAGRADIITPHALAPALARKIPRFLVAGLDDDREPGMGGWPIFTGGRYVKLCFSPAVDGIGADSLGSVPYRLPLTEADYVRYVETITGIGANDADNLARIYRFDSAEVFDACRDIRTNCPAAWRLLLSNEFKLAQGLWQNLRDPSPQLQFRYPLIDAFRIIADLERASLIMRHLTRARTILNRPDFLDALGSSLPLGKWFQGDELIEVYRWIEYASFSSAALTDLLFRRDADGVAALPQGYAPWAIARGELIGAAADFHDHPEVRKAVAHVFSKPPIVRQKPKKGQQPKPPHERRKTLLRNDEIVRWYGMTSEVLPIIALDDVRERYPTMKVANIPGLVPRPRIGDNSRRVLAAIASAVRQRADPAMQRKIAGSASSYLRGSKLANAREKTLEANTKLGMKLALTYLPRRDQPGGAARFDPLVWKTPQRDADLWRTLMDLRRGGKLHQMKTPARRQLRIAIGLMRRVYAPFFATLLWSDEVERVVCDMAFALSPISADPHIAFAIHTLGLKPSLQARLGRQLQRQGYGRASRGR